MSCSPHTPKGGNKSLRSRLMDLGRPTTPTLVVAGLGWDVQEIPGAPDFDLDASVIGLNMMRQAYSEQHFVFFNNLQSPDGCLCHTGDNRDGKGEDDDEQILVDFRKVPADLVEIIFAVSIYDAEGRQQRFGQVKNAYIRIYDGSGLTLPEGVRPNDRNAPVITRFDLTDMSEETAMVFGSFYRPESNWFDPTPDWRFRAIGQGYADGLQGIALDYGVEAIA